MSIVRSKTNDYGPATLDIQLEQGANWTLPMSLTKAGAPWNLTAPTVVRAHMSCAWAPGAVCVDLTVNVVAPATDGNIEIVFPDALSQPFQGLPAPPQKVGVNPRVFQLGGWVVEVDDATDGTTRIIDGNVQLDRDPCLT